MNNNSSKRQTHRLQPLFDALDLFFRSSGKTTQSAPYIRDSINLKRVMLLVVIALMPCLFMGIYNTGYQARAFQSLPYSLSECLSLGARVVIPIIVISYLVGGFWEVLFACVRKKEISEGFLVTGLLFALSLPPRIPLWQVAAGISFGVVIGKEIFGGTGYNVLNPALVGRAFLFFSYPQQFSGNEVYAAVDGFTRATPLAILHEAGKGGSAVRLLTDAGYTLKDMFVGIMPGSIGETSALACLLGLFFLLLTGIANWRIPLGCLIGLSATTLFFNSRASETALTYFTLPAHWHWVMGAFAFGCVFMATDPVSSCATNGGRWIYGILIGVLIFLIRVFNPAFTEGVLLSILLMNVFAPLIDHFVVKQNIKRRLARAKR